MACCVALEEAIFLTVLEICLTVELIGTPQCGQDLALSETSLLHSAHVIIILHHIESDMYCGQQYLFCRLQVGFMPVAHLAFTGKRIEQNRAGVKGAIGWAAGGCGAGIRRRPEGEVGYVRAVRHMHKADCGDSRSAGSDLAGLAPWCEKVLRFAP